MSQSLASPISFPVVRGGEPAPQAFRGAVVAIGNFDGVHRGHRAVLDVAIRRGRALGRKALALTFEPHTRSYFRPDAPLFRLSDETAKLRLLAASGLDGAIVLPFDARLAELPAEEFVRQILVERFAVAGAVVGFDFHFGRARQGSPDFLRDQGRRHGFEVEVAPPLEVRGQPVSSSAIRALLAEGRVAEAAALLGHPWFVTAVVRHGDKRGRDLGFPTANLALDPNCRLRHGIYAVRVGVGAARYDGVASFGRRPMFDNGAPLLEVFLFDFSGDLYGKSLDVAFIAWIRPELRFAALEDLIARMHDDTREAREALARAGDAFPRLGTL
ncbi:MAG: bifunctional riboflavin kinase/FAD synthetase [Variibacter sp.]|nr:bifunctional riboflavin kinase/FAD synthetase [Variibacter sp.]